MQPPPHLSPPPIHPSNQRRHILLKGKLLLLLLFHLVFFFKSKSFAVDEAKSGARVTLVGRMGRGRREEEEKNRQQ